MVDFKKRLAGKKAERPVDPVDYIYRRDRHDTRPHHDLGVSGVMGEVNAKTVVELVKLINQNANVG